LVEAPPRPRYQPHRLRQNVSPSKTSFGGIVSRRNYKRRSITSRKEAAKSSVAADSTLSTVNLMRGLRES
jgi:hypothetical protein